MAVVLLANGFFFILALLAIPDADGVRTRVQEAFRSGDLTEVDYLPLDSRRGWHQYNDCTVLQMLSSEGGSRLERALSPPVWAADDDWSGSCAVLRTLVVEGERPETWEAHRYTRYWHGYRVPAAAGFTVSGLRELRRGLTAAVWTAILLLAFAAGLRGRGRTRQAGLLFAGAAATIWAVPYFAPGITHGPGDAFLLVGLAAVVAWPGRPMRLHTLVPLAAGFGAGVAFFEMLTGQLPLAATWLGGLVLAASLDQAERGGPERSGEPTTALLLPVGAALVAFVLGAAFTVGAKQALAFALADPGAAGPFRANLRLYMSWPAGEDGWPGIALPFGRLVRQSRILTYGSGAAAYALFVGAALCWVFAAVRGWQRRSSLLGRATLLLLALTLIPVAWVLLLPWHTYVHASFMARMLPAPISLSVLAAWWCARPGAALGTKGAIASG